MKNLMTRKLLFGMLVTLVLAFGMQGIADAVRDPNLSQSLSDIVKLRGRYSTFSISLSPVFDNPDNIGETVTITLTGDMTLIGDLFGQTSPVTLTESGGIADDPLTTNTDEARNGSRFTYETDGKEFSSVRVEGRFNAPGEQTVTINGTDYNDNNDSNDDTAWTYTYRYFVTGPASANTTLGLEGLTNGYAIGDFGDADIQIFEASTTAAEHYSVTYTTTSGGFKVEHDGEFLSRSSGSKISSGLNVYLTRDTSTNVVTIKADGSDVTTRGVYVYGFPTWEVAEPTGKGSEDNPGKPGEVIRNAFRATIKDGRGSGVPGVLVTFTLTARTDAGVTNGNLIFGSGNSGTLVTATNTLILDNNGNPVTAGSSSPIHVRTNRSGVASVDFRLGSNGTETVVVTAPSELNLSSQTVTAFSGSASGIELSVLPIESVQGSPDTFNVYLRVKEDGVKKTSQNVVFTTSDGTLENTPNANPISGPTVTEQTNSDGIAEVIFTSDGSSNPQITASIEEVVGGVTITTDTVTFTVRGGSVQPPRQPTNPRLSLSTVSSANPGDSVTVTVRLLNENGTQDFLSGIPVTFIASNGSFSPQAPNTNNGTAQSNITIPSGVSSITVTVTAPNYDPAQQTISVTTPAAEEDEEEDEEEEVVPSSLVITGSNSLTGELNQFLDEDLSVRVLGSDNRGYNRALVVFSVTEGRGSLSRGSIRTDEDGEAAIRFVPRSRGTLEVEASVTGLDPVIFTITTGDPPDAIILVSGDNQSGRPGATLANPFIVEVIDENEDPVSGVGVTFAVTAGGGSVSPASATTNNNGRAQTTLTLGDARGDNTVVARVSGISEGITFTATSGAEVRVDASQRAPIYWINRSNETLHRLVGAEIENLVPSVSGIKSLAIDSENGRLYWSVQVGQRNAQIRRSNLDGTGARTVRTLTSAPSSIAIDSADGTVYWANSASGKIKSASTTEGNAKVRALVQGLSNPTAIALSNGYLYWSEATGGISRMSLTAEEKTVETIATGLGEPLSIAIAKGRIYWVESDVAGGGALQRANVDGSGNVQEVRVFTGNAPNAIAIDSLNNRLYWTKTQGKIQRANLSGRFVADIATGLMNPGGIAVGTPEAEAEPVVEETTERKQPTQTTKTQKTDSKYDVSGDGKLTDLDVDIILLAVALGAQSATYDVNGDGSVDTDDAKAVIDAVGDADAGAPAINVDVSGLDLDPDRLQEQIDLLIASGDTSFATQRMLAYFQHLLVSLRPAETLLLANYPNPFNPETWIPYHLATGTDVQVNIYNAQGVLVRALTLGHQTAGYYTSRSRAAYWDGRNALGERVASGIYFYQLQTDEVSPMRKMVILK